MKTLFIILIAGLTQACAFTDAQLDIAANPESNIIGPISEEDSIKFTLPNLQDARLNKARIGWKKNGYGQNTADITTLKPVEEIVEGALIEAIRDNGHQILIDNAEISIIGTVDHFWFETDTNFWTVEFIGDVSCTLEFIDISSKESLYKSTYSGNHRQKVAGGLEKTWTDVMNKTLDKLIEDIVFDEDLAEVLRDYKN